MKAILILDEMPNTCGECPYSYYSDLENWEDETKYCAIHKGGYLEDYNQMRAVWCPLKPLPKPLLAYDKDCKVNINDDMELGQMRGWNSYYEKLTGIDLDEEQENE